MTREQLLKTRRFTVERRTTREPGKDPVAREVVVHPGAAVVLPILEDGRILLNRQFRPTVEKALLELPAGTIDPGEKPVETAARELEEETGYRAARLEPLIEFYPSPGVLTERMYAFVATELTFVGQRLDSGEEIEVEVVPRDHVERMLIDGEFHDGKTIATLGLWFLRRQKLPGR
jgi:ADP-ribose pyrophosphatase